MRVCGEPGCPALTDGPRCAQHGRPARRRPSPRSLGYDSRWERTSKAYLLANPWCQWPGCTAPAKHTDHADGLGPLGPRGYDWDNFAGLCHSHHSTKTALYDGGFGNKPKARTGDQP